MENTLLESFVERKIKTYSEPSRRGGMRGEPIGFSKKKYLATLYMLTADKQITKAMELGISYGLLRKWNTENAFRDLAGKHRREFADTFVRHILERHAHRESAHDGLSDKPMSVVSSSLLRDAGDYSPQLLAEILKSVVALAEKAEKEGNIPTAFALLSAFMKLAAQADGGDALKELSRNAGIDLTTLAKGLKTGIIGRVKQILLKPGAGERDRNEAYRLLTDLENII